MKPFSAWLAMDGDNEDQPAKYFDGGSYGLFVHRELQNENPEVAPVLIVADTPENRQKLGMEEGS